MDKRDEAQAALTSIEHARGELAQRAASPRGYYAVVGAGAALMVFGCGLDGWLSWVLIAFGAGVEASGLSWYVRSTGVVAFATLREQGAWRAWLMIAVLVAALVASLALDSLLAAAVGALAVFVAFAVLGPQWDRAWVRSIRAQP